MEKTKLLCALVFIAYFVTVFAARKSYEGSKVLRVKAESKEHLVTLLKLRDAFDNTEPASASLVNFWTEPAVNENTDIMVYPQGLTYVRKVLEENNIPYSVFIEDVEALIRNQLEQNEAADNGRIGWEAYNSYDTISSWLDELAQNYSIASVESIGTSYEGRDLKLIKVSTGGNGNKPVIFIDGTFHAREWISPAVVTYFINQLVTNSSSYSHLLNQLDFYLLPIVNPDGYEYSRNSERLWRKTRSPISGSTCRGVDPNRNFDIDFGGSGSSTNPCAETFLGARPFSENETRLLSEYVLASAAKIKAYLSMHSYSQVWLTPYAWSASPPPNFNEIMSVGQKAIDALRSHFGTEYRVGPTSTTLYFHSGASQDWTKDVAGIKYTYTPELRDTGRYGFLLPPDQIIPSCIETWAAVQVVAEEMIKEL